MAFITSRFHFMNFPVAPGAFLAGLSRESKGEPRFSGKSRHFAGLAGQACATSWFFCSKFRPAGTGHGLSGSAGPVSAGLLLATAFICARPQLKTFPWPPLPKPGPLRTASGHAGLLELFCIAAAARFIPAIYLWRPRGNSCGCGKLPRPPCYIYG